MNNKFSWMSLIEGVEHYLDVFCIVNLNK